LLQKVEKEENYNRSNREKKISVTQAVNELEFIVDSESENNGDDDDDTIDAYDEGRDEQGEEEKFQT